MYYAQRGRRTKTTGSICVPVLPAVYAEPSFALVAAADGLKSVPVVFDPAVGKDTRRGIAAGTCADEHVADIQQARVTRVT
jgi:hypothetical protein